MRVYVIGPPDWNQARCLEEDGHELVFPVGPLLSRFVKLLKADAVTYLPGWPSHWESVVEAMLAQDVGHQVVPSTKAPEAADVTVHVGPKGVWCDDDGKPSEYVSRETFDRLRMELAEARGAE